MLLRPGQGRRFYAGVGRAELTGHQFTVPAPVPPHLTLGLPPCLSNCTVLSCSVVSNSLQSHGLWPARLLCPLGFSRQEYGSELPYLLQDIFPTQESKVSNPGLPRCRQILYHLSHQGSP